jgi:branched-chain amino acid aminotransferase
MVLSKATELAWHNGEIIQREKAAPSVASHSFHLGIGVFDGLMAYWNSDHYNLLRISEHLDRFCRNSTSMGLEFNWTSDDLKKGVEQLLARVPATTYYVRPIAYRGAPQLSVTQSAEMRVDVAIFGVPVPRDELRPVRCRVSPIERVSSRAIPIAWKVCGLYANSYLARREAEAKGFDDAIFLDRGGRISELSAANVFFVCGDRLVTPSLDCDVFPGITREVVFSLARTQGIEVEERTILPPDLTQYEAAFLSSTLMELQPIVRIDGRLFTSQENTLFKKILASFREITRQ